MSANGEWRRKEEHDEGGLEGRIGGREGGGREGRLAGSKEEEEGALDGMNEGEKRKGLKSKRDTVFFRRHGRMVRSVIESVCMNTF